MRKCWISAMACFLLTWLACCPVAAEETRIALVFHPAPGQVFIEKEEYSLKFGFQLPETDAGEEEDPEGSGSGTMEFRLGFLSRVAVKAAEDKGRVTLGTIIIAVMQDFSIPIPSMPMHLRLDTTDPLALPPEETLLIAAQVGEEYTTVVEPTGELFKVTGLDELVERVAKRLATTEKGRKPLAEELRKQFRQGQSTNTSYPTDYAGGIYPAAPVAVGESWESESCAQINGLLVATKNRFTLEACREGKAFIALESEIKSLGADLRTANFSDGPGTTFQGRQQGSFVVDLATGWILRCHLEQELTGTVTSPDPEDEVMHSGSITIGGRYDLAAECR